MDMSAQPNGKPAAGATKVLKSVCRSCHGGCGALLHVKNGELIKVEGDPDSPAQPRPPLPDRDAPVDLVYHPR